MMNKEEYDSLVARFLDDEDLTDEELKSIRKFIKSGQADGDELADLIIADSQLKMRGQAMRDASPELRAELDDLDEILEIGLKGDELLRVYSKKAFERRLPVGVDRLIEIAFADVDHEFTDDHLKVLGEVVSKWLKGFYKESQKFRKDLMVFLEQVLLEKNELKEFDVKFYAHSIDPGQFKDRPIETHMDFTIKPILWKVMRTESVEFVLDLFSRKD